MNTATVTRRQKVLRLLEWVFALIGALVCLAVVFLFTYQQSESLWPTPGLYFIEIVALGLLGFSSRWADTQQRGRFWGAVPWVVGGLLLSFVILAGLSIGPFLFPGMLAFWLAGAAADLRQERGMVWHLGVTLLAAVLQSALIIGIVVLNQG